MRARHGGAGLATGPVATAMARARLFCATHSLPVALVVLTAVGTLVQALLARWAGRALLGRGARARAGSEAAAAGRPAQVRAGAADQDTSVLDLDQLSLRDCTLASMGKLRIRIADLDEVLARRAGQRAGGTPSVAGMMQTYRPVNADALQAAERSNVEKLLR